MTLERSVEVFVKGFSFLRSFTRPYEAVRHGPLWVMRDPPGAKGYQRLQEIVSVGVGPREALRALKDYGPGRHALAFVGAMDDDYEASKRVIKAAGYKLLRSEPMFYRLTGDNAINRCPFPVRRVSTEEDAAAMARATRGRPLRPEYLNEEAPHRVFGAFQGQKVFGWVNSSTVGNDAWVSNMVVQPEYRRQGIGSALMGAMLAEDHRLGIENSVLLATNAGSQLYPRVGYQQIGLLQLFMPAK